MTDPKLSKPVAWTLFFILALTWGSSFILMKRGLESFSYSQISFIRIASAWIFTAVLAFRHYRYFKRKHLWPVIAVGLFGNAIPYTLFPLAVTRLDSSLVGILNSMVPLFTLIIGLVWFGIRVRWLSVLGILLGLGGAVWLLVPDASVDADRLLYGVFPILATICYAISINVINTRLTEVRPVAITLFSLTAVGPLSGAYVLSTDFVQIMQTDPQAWLHLFYVVLLGVLGSSLAIVIFSYLIKGSSSLFAASVTYLIPVVALFWGYADGEAIGWYHLGGMLAILSGIYLINKKGSPAARIRRQQEEAV
jgi:drug/metabolite transporter (DMT)-like permease